MSYKRAIDNRPYGFVDSIDLANNYFPKVFEGCRGTFYKKSPCVFILF